MRTVMIALAVLAAGCSSSQPVAEQSSSDTMLTASTPPSRKVGIPYGVPADPNAAYSLVGVRSADDGNIIAMTRRIGPSGVSFSRREIDCRRQRARYIGEGDTYREAERAAANPGEMASSIEGSSTHAAVQVACAAR